MPQWRKLHSKITESLDVNDMPDDFTRLLWVLLPTQLCREGRGVDNPSWVRSRVFPMREDVTLKMVSAALSWFEQRGMIARYQVDGRAYFHVPTFHHYQGSTDREGQSEYPAPPECVASDARLTRDLLMSRSVLDVDADVDSDSDVDADADTPRARVDAIRTAAANNGFAGALSSHGIIVNSPIQSDMWQDIWNDAGPDLFSELLDEAAKAHNGVPTVKYVDAILKRCRSEGVAPGQWKTPRNGQSRASPLSAVDAAIEQYGREERAKANGDI